MKKILLSELYIKLKSSRRTRKYLERSVAPLRRADDMERNIFMFWNKGRENASPVCQICIRSWEVLNPNWKVHVLDQAAADTILPRDSFPPEMSINHYANMLRMTLLRQYGGVWADATLLCLKPLDDWLLPQMMQSDFFVFARPGRDRIISNWFLASMPDALLLRHMLTEAHAYWDKLGGRSKPYFWFHYMFEYLTISDPALRRAWSNMPKLGAVPLHALQTHFAGDRDRELTLATLRHTPVQKLNHRAKASIEDYYAVLTEIDWPYLAEI